MMYLGDFRAGKTVRFMWSSNGSDGASITRQSNGTIAVYKDGSTSESSAGITDTEDFDTKTGIHYVTILTSDAFYAAGSDFAVVLQTATVDGKTVNAVLAHFSIEARSALRSTAADRTLDVSSGGEAGIDLANVGSPTTSLNLSGLTIKTATDVEADTADVQSRLPAALVSGRMDASVGAVAAGVDFSATMKASIGTEADWALADVGLSPTVTGRLDVAVSSRGTGAALDAAGVRTAVGLAAANLDTQLADVPTVAELEARTVVSANYATAAAVAALPSAAAVNAEVDTALADVGLSPTVTGRLDVAVSSRGTGAALDAAGVRSAVGLAAANLDTQLAAGTSAVLAALAALEDLSAAQVETAVLDALSTGRSELSSLPAADGSPLDKLELVHMALRNLVSQSATERKIHRSNGAVLGTAAVADASGVLSIGRMT